MMGEIFTVETRGIGKPDYSKEVSAGRERAGLTLKYNQSMVVLALICTDIVPHPYAISWVKDLIPIAGSARLIDISTGQATPYTVPKGYSVEMIQKAFGGNQDNEVNLYYDGLYIVQPNTTLSGGAYVYENTVAAYTTLTLDPVAAAAHLIDVLVVNRGGAALRGAFTMTGILEAVWTKPLPDTKDCQCPFCHHLQTVRKGTTVIKCNNCSETYYVQDFSHIREL